MSEIRQFLATKICLVCGKPASFGFGVRLTEGKLGRWYCADHREDQPKTRESAKK
ncbi:hypothetical protein C7450_103125 [Chelatococcus asaccharovorans]|uniref:Uncharacterized protein n=1 Tax=Chelatococcus asaccharovorans TaxID=28210 RepID=A0A2V3UBW2_9HYPH|nr:hypothetical protein C7450_103125 [Chelatococcus asaccharovorans]